MFRFVFLLTIPMAAFQKDSPPSASDRETEMYRIYSLLMNDPETNRDRHDNPRYLIAESTSPGLSPEPCVRPPKDREAEFKEVLEDFAARRGTPTILQRKLSLRKPYELLTAEEVKDFQRERLRSTPDPDQPNSRFAGVTDFFMLSNVYFSKSGKLALTAVSSWCGSLCALQKWKVLENVPASGWLERPWDSCIIIAGAHPNRFIGD